MARTRTVESIRRELDTLKKREAALRAQAKEMEHRNEERRKLLVAGVVLDQADRDAGFGSTLSRLLEEHVRDQADRELLGLPPVGESTPQPERGAAESEPEAAGGESPVRSTGAGPF